MNDVKTLDIVALLYLYDRVRGCGKFVSKTLAERVHVCPCCGLVLDRDVNVARNILRREIGLVRAESTPVGDSASVEGVVPLMHVVSLNQEAHLL